MTAINSLIFLSIPFALFAGVFSALARWRGLALQTYWATPLGALAPWIIATVLAFIASMLVKESVKQAAVMTVLFPMFGAMACFGVACIVALFMGADGVPRTRFVSAATWSGVLAASVLAYLLYVMFVQEA
jgi:Na+/phosphate symporter